MWHEAEETRLPVGIGSIDRYGRRFTFGAVTVRAWNLDRFHSATVRYNDSPGLIAIQLFENGDGARKLLSVRVGDKTMTVNCAGALRKAGALPGRYKMHKDRSGFITVDSARGKPDQFSPRRRSDG